jgi:hypothetical protein
LTEAQPLDQPDLVTVALKVPDAVLCLISALAYHEMTTQETLLVERNTMLHFHCPHCANPLSAPEDCSGKSSKCRKCGTSVTVPYTTIATEAKKVSVALIVPTPAKTTLVSPDIVKFISNPLNIIALCLLGLLGLAGWMVIGVPYQRANYFERVKQDPNLRFRENPPESFPTKYLLPF